MHKFILITLFFSCQVSNDLINKNPEKIISLERTACFGSCPIYKIEIFTNGNGTYTGKQFVENLGVINFKISTKKIQEIINYAEDIDFFKMEDRYYEPISDLPTTITIIKEKKIINYSGGPKQLRLLEKLIDRFYQDII